MYNKMEQAQDCFVVTRMQASREEFIGITPTGEMWQQKFSEAIHFSSKQSADDFKQAHFPDDQNVKVIRRYREK